MITSSSKLVCSLAAVLALAGCSGSPKKDSETITMQEMKITDGAITSDDGSRGAISDYDNTGLEAVYEVLTFEEITILDEDGNEIIHPEVPANSTFSIVLKGIKNYTNIDGRVFPKLMLSVSGGNVAGPIIYNEDLLADQVNGLTENEATRLSATVNAGEKMVSGNQYICSVQVNDKKMQNSYIMVTWMFVVK